MEIFRYLNFDTKELIDLIFISFIISLLFSLFFLRLGRMSYDLISMILFLFLFIFVLLASRMTVMKAASYWQGFIIKMYQTTFDQYGLRSYDKLSWIQRATQETTYDDPTYHFQNRQKRKEKFGRRSKSYGGIPTGVISLIIFIFTLGLIVFPSMWRYRGEKIPHRFIGRQNRFEVDEMGNQVQGIPGLRFAKVMFTGFLYYFVFALLLRFILGGPNDLFYMLFFIIFWVSLVTLLPIPGTEGFDLWHCSKLFWIMSLTMMMFGLFAVLIFQSVAYTILVTALVIFMAVLVYLWKVLM